MQYSTGKLLARCKLRSENPFETGHQTRKNRDGTWTVYYAFQKQCDPRDFRDAGLSILPIAKNGFAIEAYTQNGKNWESFYGVNDWKKKTWKQSYGVQVYTGAVSDFLTDLDFEYEIIANRPDAFAEMLRQLCDLVPNPLLTISKSGGVRFSSRTPDYIHPNKTENKEYIGDYSVEPRILYLEVFGEKGLSRYDARYEIVEGSLWDIPTIPADAIFEILDAYRYEIGTPYQPPKNAAATPKKQRPANKSPQKTKKSRKGTRPTAKYDDNGNPIGIEWSEPDPKGDRKSKQIYACNMTEHKKSKGDMRFYQTRDGRISQHCHNCGENRIFDTPRVPRYTINTDHQHETSDIDTQRAENQNVIAAWLTDTENSEGKHLLINTSAAGTGKTTAAIVSADTIFYIAKTTEQADEVYQVLFERGDDVIRHRPRMFNRDRDDWDTLPIGLSESDRPCIQPEMCNLYAERGHSTNHICDRCDAAAICDQDGFLAQKKKETTKRKIVIAWDEVVACDEIHAARVKMLCSADDILIVDEVNASNLHQHRYITREMLHDLTERFRDPNTAEQYRLLKKLHDLISTADTDTAFFDGLKAWLNTIDDLEKLDRQIERYPVGCVYHKASPDKKHAFDITMHYCGKEITVPVAERETHDDTQCFEIDSEQEIALHTWLLEFMPFRALLKAGLVQVNDPPIKHNAFASTLKRCIDERSPFTFDSKAQRFDFYLKPTLNHRRAIFNTASDTDNLIGECYRDTDVEITRHTGTPPAWKDALVCQISTGNYLPRHSLVTKAPDGTKRPDKKALEFIDGLIRPTIAAGYKVLTVAPKAMCEMPELADLNAGENALINHHRAEGQNEYENHDIAFVFHYEPEHNDLQETAKRIFQNAEPPLDFTRDKRKVTVNGVTFDKTIYTDKRVQAVYKRECRARLMQALMRLRPNIHAGKILVLLTAEPIDIPITPQPFTPADAEHFTGDWKAFSQLLNETDVRAIAERDNVSERTAERKSKPARDKTKAERDALILKLHRENVPQGKIVNQLKTAGFTKGITQSSVSRAIKKLCKNDKVL